MTKVVIDFFFFLKMFLSVFFIYSFVVIIEFGSSCVRTLSLSALIRLSFDTCYRFIVRFCSEVLLLICLQHLFSTRETAMYDF